ncbi:folylpolyglutamate synthase/dihydrofolate synthase family protein [Haloechinothrix sp. LS1_15]|uniref:bifunctional folylpolyglutamate synthase/dihydrofolate synthase n=1 Tax=Haloechinothrix sp. LS1_15 TaxID=2652248 RepID=UPI0029444842|nr:folylpolyglutamate synthase/dihydrofolate synthase family protein [Haloechinothrix sp. LS1_15]MDV6012034.1 bifunctional folylpolyglutamate synthase/dihydrofolate synthase [Haloechinothrix sp. LS1_15]
MPDTPETPDEPIEPDPEVEQRAHAELRSVEAELNQRWGETKIAPTIQRITALLNMVGDPQHNYPVIQVAGTNGKGSVVRMIEGLLTRMGLRVGRFTSPHLQLVTERISVDGVPISASTYVDSYRDLEPFIGMVDDARAPDAPRMTKFEVLSAMAFSVFADAPVDVAVLETGMGGTWDATNVAEAQVAAITPVSLDHREYLGDDLVSIAREKAGVIGKEGVAVLAEQEPDALRTLLERAVEVDAAVARAGQEFGVLRREKGVGGQQLSLQGLGGVYDDIFLPAHGEHQAANAALALAAVEAFFGAGKGRQLVIEAIREGFAELELPGRLEPVRGAPTVLLDAAHNPHAARALATAIDAEFAFRRLVAVVAVLDDKDVTGILEAIEPVVSDIVVTTNSSPRAVPPERLAEIARPIFGEDRVHVSPRLDSAVEAAVTLVEHTDDPEEPLAGGGVLITGSVVTAGEARALFGKEPA